MKTKEQIVREKNWDKLALILIKRWNLDKSLNTGDVVLDFGCGQGVFTNILAKKFAKCYFIGFDIADKELEKAKNWYHRKNLKFVEKLPLKYDAIISTFSFHETKNLSKELKIIYSKLRNNGKIFIYDFRKNTKAKFKKVYQNNPNPKKGSFEEEYKEHNRWNLKKFENMMTKVGFNKILIKPHKDNFLFYIGEKQRNKK